MAKKPNLPVRVRRLKVMVEAGQTVHLSLRHSEVGDERNYWLEPSGKPVGEWTVAKALELGVIEPAGDALFVGLESQSYRATTRASVVA